MIIILIVDHHPRYKASSSKLWSSSWKRAFVINRCPYYRVRARCINTPPPLPSHVSYFLHCYYTSWHVITYILHSNDIIVSTCNINRIIPFPATKSHAWLMAETRLDHETIHSIISYQVMLPWFSLQSFVIPKRKFISNAACKVPKAIVRIWEEILKGQEKVINTFNQIPHLDQLPPSYLWSAPYQRPLHPLSIMYVFILLKFPKFPSLPHLLKIKSNLALNLQCCLQTTQVASESSHVHLHSYSSPVRRANLWNANSRSRYTWQ
jgi:hypothetical protein